jgi:hypothetical protein
MQDGQQGLANLYSTAKKQKLISKNELNAAENAMVNLGGFTDYKLAEFSKRQN